MTHVFDIREEVPEIVMMGRKRVMFTNDPKYMTEDVILMQKGRESEVPFIILARVSEIAALRKGYDLLILEEEEH